MGSVEAGFLCILTSFLWGVTNPLIKKSTKSISGIQTKNCLITFFNEIKYLAVNWKYIFLFLVNQAGSVLYFFALQNLDLSLIVPIVNALTFVITALTGIFFGENIPDFRTFSGLMIIIIGLGFCVIDKFFPGSIQK